MKNESNVRPKVMALSFSRTRVLCPKCEVEMNPANLFGIEVEKCPACEGIFFDRGETEKLVHRKLRFHWLKATLWCA